MHRVIVPLLALLLTARGLTAQQRAFVVDSAWLPVRIDQPMHLASDNPDSEPGPNVLHFRNGSRLIVELFDLQFLGQLPRPGRAPFLLLGGHGCSACDIETQVYLVPADADSIGLPRPLNYFPGTLAAAGLDDNSPFYRGRLFIGKCLADRRPTAVWFESERDSTGRWQPDVYRLDATADTATGQFLTPRPPLRATLAAVRAGTCHEVPGIVDTEG